MKNWNKSDVGKKITYRKKVNEDLDSRETFAICRTYPKSDFLGVIDYPIELSSRYQVINISRNKEIFNENELNYPGEWCFDGKVSKDELSVLEKISSEF